MSDCIAVRVRSWPDVMVGKWVCFIQMGERYPKRVRRKARMRRKRRRGWA